MIALHEINITASNHFAVRNSERLIYTNLYKTIPLRCQIIIFVLK